MKKRINTDFLADEIMEFVEKRNWMSFNTPENLAKSISIEASELLELYQWSSNGQETNRLKEEIADVLIYTIELTEILGFDIKEIIKEKIKKNAVKYPLK